MDTKEYVTLQVERTRGQLRAAAFIRMGKNSLCLRGKTTAGFISDLIANGNKPIELVDALPSSVLLDPPEGDIVSAENAFRDDEGVIWTGNSISFETEEGAIVSPNQYEYLKERPLGSARIFAETEQPAQSVRSTWKSLSRIAREARVDRAREIFYLTFGELIWEQKQGKREGRRAVSPLFILPIKEENTSGELFKFRLAGAKAKQNSVLRREVLKQTGINIYEGCSEELTLQELEAGLDILSKNISDYVAGMRVEKGAFHICILDSHDEGVCQAVEKKLDAISASPITRVLSGECPFEILSGYAKPVGRPAIFPLPADESQLRVVRHVLEGESVHSPAPAGAGKSQTSVNIAANLAISGRSVCVMSEKLAANEVFMDYAGRIGLDKYCLSVNSNMKTADIVRQIKSIVKIKRQYVKTSAASDASARYRSAVEEYEKLCRELYTTDPDTDCSLYELITVALSADELERTEGISVTKKNYLPLKRALSKLSSTCFQVMTDSEFEEHFYGSPTSDPELEGMLRSAIRQVREEGLDPVPLIKNNRLCRREASDRLIAALARALALNIIGDRDLGELGNRRIKAIYKSLVDAHLEMERLFISYMHQELSARIADNADDQFISTLEKLRVTKVTPQELFQAYGSEILAICPIVVTTPTAASNYIYGSGLDDFHTMIIDEASQMQIISLLPYLDRIRQIVVFGDHMQLGITTLFMKSDLVSTEDTVSDTSYIDRSVLQAVQGRLPSYSLGYHYRSATEMLIHVSNKTCYDRLLEVVPDTYTDRAALPDHLGLEVIRVEPILNGKRGVNEAEADSIVAEAVKLREEHPDRSIGIIAFNEKQQEAIVDRLEEGMADYEDGERLWVRSLENAQGKEADFVLISIGHCRRNANGELHLGISEINKTGGENRLNVLFTRARCKNFIFISFDHRELRRSENAGVRRLYEYIDYALRGRLNEVSASSGTNADHSTVRCISKIVSGIDGGFAATPRIGSDNMAVDVAVRRAGAPRYALGILLPTFGQTSAQTVTKVMVLERAGWHLSPLSPIYFLTSPELLRAQLERDLAEPIAFVGECHSCFDTYRAPDRPFTFASEAFASDEEIEAITEDDFIAMDLENIYRGVISAALYDLDVRELNARAKNGDTEANLLLLIRLRERFIREDKRRALLSNINRLYVVQKESRACFLFAQILRIDDIGSRGKLIENLLKEAHVLGIGGDG